MKALLVKNSKQDICQNRYIHKEKTRDVFPQVRNPLLDNPPRGKPQNLESEKYLIKMKSR